MSYVPGKMPLRMYWPRPSLTAVCIAFVPVLVSVTVAPGRTPPLESWMVPRMVPVVDPWPSAVVLASSSAQRVGRRRRNCRGNRGMCSALTVYSPRANVPKMSEPGARRRDSDQIWTSGGQICPGH